MKARDLMTPDPAQVTPSDSLQRVSQLMAEHDCGCIPVVTGADQRSLVGVVTDRDLYIALATRNRCAADLTVGDVAQSPVHTCTPEDEADAVLATMRTHRVRRVPVEGFGGTVLGDISLDDVAVAAGADRALADRDVVATLQAIRSQHHPAQIAAV